MTERRNVYIRIHSPVSNYNLYTKVYNFEWLNYNIELDGNWLGNQEDVLVKLVYSLLCAAVLLYTAVFAGLGCTIREQANQFDMLTKQAQSGSVDAEIGQVRPDFVRQRILFIGFCMAGRRFEYRSLIFFAILSVLALSTFSLIRYIIEFQYLR